MKKTVLPHVATEDIYSDRFLITKRSCIIRNVWVVLYRFLCIFEYIHTQATDLTWFVVFMLQILTVWSAEPETR